MTALKETVIDFTIPWSEGSGWSLLYRKTKPRRFVLTIAAALSPQGSYCRDMYWFLHSMNWNSWGSVLSCFLGTVALVYLFDRFVMRNTGKQGIYILMGDAELH